MTLRRKFPVVPGLQLVRAPEGSPLSEVIRTLEEQPGVLYAEPDPIRMAAAVPNDPRFPELWGLHNTGQAVDGASPGAADFDLDAVEAWDLVSGGAVRVAVIDTGIAYDHPDLAPNIFVNPGESGAGREGNGLDDDANGVIDDHHGWDFVNEDNDPYDDAGHGTHVAGTIAARGNNGIGTTGVAWNASLLPIKAGSATGTFRGSDVLQAYSYAWKMGADVVNLSFGGAGYSQAERDVMAAARELLFVAAAGNDGTAVDGADRTYPCSYELENVICVGAAASDGSMTDWSNYSTTNVDLAAPGSSILSQRPSTELILQDHFDDGAAATRWTSGALMGTSSWTLTGSLFASAAQSLTDSPGGNYEPSEDTYMAMAQPFSLSGRGGCWVDYEVRGETQFDADVFYVEGWDGDEWSVLDSGSGSTQGEFIPLEAPLGADFTDQPDVRLRFGLSSDATIQRDGVYVDDVAVRCPGRGAYTGAEARFLDGTSMAAPHVSGVAALVLAQWPQAPVSYVRRALLGSVTADARLRPYVATGGLVNARAALDDAGPAPFSLTTPTSGSVAGAAPRTLTWEPTSDAKTGVQKFQLIVDGEVVVDNVPAAATQVDYRFPAGVHGWTIRAVDHAGNATHASPAVIRADPTAPTMSFSARRLGRLVKRGRVRLPVTVDEAASVRVRLQITIPRTAAGRKRKIKLARTSAIFGPGTPVFDLRLSKRRYKQLKGALRHVRGVRATLVVEATDGVGNRRAQTTRIKVKRPS